MKPSVYLAGPITGLSRSGTTSWRDVAMEMLAPEVDAFSPLRSKDYLLNETSISDSYEQHVMSSQLGIFARDFYDCINRDLIIANLAGADRVSIGTVMEIAWGYQARKPIVLIMPEGDTMHDHAMLREACPFRVNTLEEAVHIAKSLLLPVPH